MAENLANKDLFLVSATSTGVALFLINNVIKLSDDQLSRDPKISIRCLLCKLSQSIPLN